MIKFLCVHADYSGSSSVTQSTCNVNSPINECPTTSSSSRAGTTGTTDATGPSTVTSTPTSTTTVPPSPESISGAYQF